MFEVLSFNFKRYTCFNLALMRSGQFSYKKPIIQHLKKFTEQNIKEINSSQLLPQNNLNISQNIDDSSLPVLKAESNISSDPAIISFIPTTSTTPNTTLTVYIFFFIVLCYIF